MWRWASIAAIVLTAAIATAAVAAEGADAAAVLVEEYAYQPASVTIAVGGTVSWTVGRDPEQHTVTPRGHDAWEDSGQLFTGDLFEVRLDRPGRYEYLCTLHPTMVGTVTVVAGATAPAESSAATGAPGPTAAPEPTPTREATAPPASGTDPAPTSPADPAIVPEPAAGGPELAPLAVLVVVGVLVLGGLFALRRRTGGGA